MEKNRLWSESQSPCFGLENKPVEIYLFIDPLCPECWALEPIIKKLKIEYGHYFTLRHVLSGKLASLNNSVRKKPENIAQAWEKTASRSGMSCDGSLWFENPISAPSLPSVAIKAAELQGKRTAARFLRKVQENLFLEKQNISNVDVLLDCAEQVGIDMELFKQDITSESATKAFQCDLTITSEMDVTEIPTLVFFNENTDEEGIKVTGCYPYEVYVEILFEMLKEQPKPSPPPPIEAFLKFFNIVATKEISVVYDLTTSQVEHEMKKLLLKQKVERIPAKYGTFWRYIGDHELNIE